MGQSGLYEKKNLFHIFLDEIFGHFPLSYFQKLNGRLLIYKKIINGYHNATQDLILVSLFPHRYPEKKKIRFDFLCASKVLLS